MLAEGGADGCEDDPEAFAELSTPVSLEALGSPAESVMPVLSPERPGEGVEAAVPLSSTAARTSTLESEAEWDILACESFPSDVAPVLARLCFGCSESEGERDLLRVESASGMVVSFSDSSGRVNALVSAVHGVWEVGLGIGGRRGRF